MTDSQQASVTRVPRNRWDVLDVPALGTWSPEARVSVVVPYYEAEAALRLTLAALSEQTYPRELIEVIVVDDGSDPPLAVPSGFDELDLRVIHQEDRGFGLARARNTGAKAATGDILVFLDCDMVPERQQIEAHARWHHVAADAVTLGFRRHVDYDGIAADDVRAASKRGDLSRLFEGRDVKRPEWIEGHMVRTRDLTSNGNDLFRVVTGGNLGIRAETYWRVGGHDESFTQWGAEDTELGYRLYVDGALLVPEREAMCWHQGHGHEPEPHELESLELQRAKLAHLIAHRGFRSGARGRTFQIPRVAVRLTVGDTPRDALVPVVEAVLASEFHDLRLLLAVSQGHPDRAWLERQFGPDARVQVDRDPAPHPYTPILIEVPPTAMLAPSTVGTLVDLLESADDPLGVVHVTVPGKTPRTDAVCAALTRALRRGERAATDGEDPYQVAGELFGERWLSGTDVGLRAYGTEPSERPGGSAPVLGQSQGMSSDVLREAWQLFSLLEPSQRDVLLATAKQVLGRTTPRQRSLLIAVAKRVSMLLAALGTLTRARSLRAALRGAAEVARAVLPWAVFVRLRGLFRSVRP